MYDTQSKFNLIIEYTLTSTNQNTTNAEEMDEAFWIWNNFSKYLMCIAIITGGLFVSVSLFGKYRFY